jgi:hypothetical protein
MRRLQWSPNQFVVDLGIRGGDGMALEGPGGRGWWWWSQEGELIDHLVRSNLIEDLLRNYLAFLLFS